MAEILLERVSKRYPNGAQAVRELSLGVADGELVALLGPSGSGKTTTLRLIAGLEAPDQGEISIGGQRVARHPPHRRQIAMTFQSPALYPHLNVWENLVFHYRLQYNSIARWFRRLSVDLRRHAEEVSGLLRLDALLGRRPAELSGGERQRVALGRVLIRRPAVFLLDEPLAHVDGPLRQAIRETVRQLQRQRQATMLWVTHDVAEALAVADRVAVLAEGCLQQLDTPEALRRQPVNKIVELLVEGRT
jgi:multiple sugar transport system ATP-binding protein